MPRLSLHRTHQIKTRPIKTPQHHTTMKTFHHSKLTSPRLQKLLAYLQECSLRGCTTLEIAQACCSTRPSSDCSELRANGVQIETQFEGTNENGRRIYRYTLLP